jgi:hypothetical protein
MMAAGEWGNALHRFANVVRAGGEGAMRGLVHAAACGLLGTVLVIAGAPGARAADEDEPGFDQKIIQNVLQAIGLRGGADIEYRERSPLVLPPKVDLPAPQPNAAAAAPNWPVDAEAKRRKQNSNRRFDEVNDTRPLRPDELNVGPRQRSRTGTSQDHPDGKPMGPAELGNKGGVFGSLFGGGKNDNVTFKEEPPRSTLTAPPVGYQTPSPTQPYGPPSTQSTWTPATLFDRGTDQK